MHAWPLAAAQNATTLASKFRDLYGLELALKQELRELGRTQARRTPAAVVHCSGRQGPGGASWAGARCCLGAGAAAAGTAVYAG